jgi:hypothetical protein
MERAIAKKKQKNNFGNFLMFTIKINGKSFPTEVEDHIFEFAGPLTRWLTGRCSIADRKIRSDQYRRSLWSDAFSLGWKGLDQLPFLPEHKIYNEEWYCVNNKDYYHWLLNKYPSKELYFIIPLRQVWLDEMVPFAPRILFDKSINAPVKIMFYECNVIFA